MSVIIKENYLVARFFLIICGLFFILLIGGCSNAPKEVYGEKTVCCSTLITSSMANEHMSFELPIISENRIRTAEFEDYLVSGVGDYNIILEDYTNGGKYNGKYYGFLHFSVSVSNKTPANFDIVSFTININGSSYFYSPKKMHFYNTAGLFDDKINDNDDGLIYETPPIVLRSELPKDKANTETIEFVAQKDITFLAFKPLDFVDVNYINYKINDKAVDIHEDGIEIKKGDSFAIEYYLNYKKGIKEYDLVKTSFYIEYSYDSERALFDEAQGFIIYNISEDQAIKEYIDILNF